MNREKLLDLIKNRKELKNYNEATPISSKSKYNKFSRKQRKLNSILKRLNSWADVGQFKYREYKDFEETRRYEFSNKHIAIVYFPEYEKEHINGSCGFWWGVKHHFPMKLAKDITSFLYKYGK
jgi:hypothetical protein